MSPQDHIKLNKAKCLLMYEFVKFKVIELLTQLKIHFSQFFGLSKWLTSDENTSLAVLYDLKRLKNCQTLLYLSRSLCTHKRCQKSVF